MGNEGLGNIHCVGTVDSCMNTAFSLIKENRFPVWDSVQANMQTAGKGQMGRKWVSLEGNIFSAIRLPNSAPFNNSAAAIAIGALCASALRSMGCKVFLKWPNDLVIYHSGQYKKVAGILVEDKPEGIIAGIGINTAASPTASELDRVEALSPGTLDCPNVTLPNKWEFWRLLVKHIHSIYKNESVFETIWRTLADELLLWRSLKVKVFDEGKEILGQLIGVAANGSALLRTPEGIEEISHGIMSLEDMENNPL